MEIDWIKDKVKTELKANFDIFILKRSDIRTKFINQNYFYKSTFKSAKGKRFFAIVKRSDINQVESPKAFTQNFFCYPIEDNIMKESNFILPYFERFQSFQEFDKTMTKIYDQITQNYHFFPKNIDQSERVDNKDFFIWCFILVLLSIKKDKPLFVFDQNNYFLIIRAFCELLKKNKKYFYKAISSYSNQITQLIKLTQKRPLSISQYRKAYCQICYQYFCKVHFFNEKVEESLDDFKVIKTTLKKMSGERKYFYSLDLMENDIIEQNIKCEAGPCKLNTSVTLTNIHGIEENHIEIYKSINKNDFYILNCYLGSRVTWNACFYRKLFRSQYSCCVLEKIIKLCTDESNSVEIDKYLTYDKMGKFILPKISTEKLKVIDNDDQIMFNLIVQQNQKNKKRMDYIPCDHPGECTDRNCICVSSRGYCEKFCICCNRNCFYAFPGCNCTDGCHIKSKNEEASKCICIKEERECDPDTCKKCKKIKNEYCYNMMITKKKFKKTTVSQSLIIPSAGLFACEDIHPFELIDEYLGEVIVKEEFERRSTLDKQFDRNYGFGLTEAFDIDALRAGNVLRYVNHLSFGNDNCYARARFARGITKIVLYSNRMIQKGEELYFDYHMNNCSWIAKYNKKNDKGVYNK